MLAKTSRSGATECSKEREHKGEKHTKEEGNAIESSSSSSADGRVLVAQWPCRQGRNLQCCPQCSFVWFVHMRISKNDTDK